MLCSINNNNNKVVDMNLLVKVIVKIGVGGIACTYNILHNHTVKQK